jgi:hypothetical protein
MGRVEQYHTHTRIVDGYKISPVPMLVGIKLYPYPYPEGMGIHDMIFTILHSLVSAMAKKITHPNSITGST